MINEHGKRMLPELLRFACDPQLDAITRSWIFDALRKISGQSLGDDLAAWQSWYRRVAGREAPRVNDPHQALAAGALLQP